MQGTKIATCCYCGTRAALVLRGRERHELSCASCGAPLHAMKMLRADHAGEQARPAPVRTGPMADPGRGMPPVRRPKPRKGLGRRFIEEAFDLIEDIFD
ncbi:MAG: hypothetical protein MUF63_06290 [Rhodobacteraceae bacterium]|jgi:hypothetical protein|nr:hypothetical protein [Paracoccaceae bacterium]